MAGLFYHLGRLVGPKVRQANWVYRSLAGTEAESVRAEQAVGLDLARAFVRELPPDPDPAVKEFVEGLGARLTSCLTGGLWAFRFLPVLAPEANAFALPGGFIFVARPLLELCRWDRDETAFILGHEMGHVLKRHAIDRLMANSFLSTLMSRLPLGGGLVRPQVAADVLGLRLMEAAGHDPAAAVRLLARLGGPTGAGAAPFGYFASHPPTEVRIRHAERWLATRPTP